MNTKKSLWSYLKGLIQPTPHSLPELNTPPLPASVEESAPTVVKKKRSYAKRKPKQSGNGNVKPAE